jgi:hypothetical protein
MEHIKKHDSTLQNVKLKFLPNIKDYNEKEIRKQKLNSKIQYRYKINKELKKRLIDIACKSEKIQCSANTLKNEQCTRTVKPGYGFCYNHQKSINEENIKRGVLSYEGQSVKSQKLNDKSFISPEDLKYIKLLSAITRYSSSQKYNKYIKNLSPLPKPLLEKKLSLISGFGSLLQVTDDIKIANCHVEPYNGKYIVFNRLENPNGHFILYNKVFNPNNGQTKK